MYLSATKPATLYVPHARGLTLIAELSDVPTPIPDTYAGPA